MEQQVMGVLYCPTQKCFFFLGVFAMQFGKTGSLFVVMSLCHVEQLGFNQASFHEILYWGDIFYCSFSSWYTFGYNQAKIMDIYVNTCVHL
jgi:hypothetical protein